MHVIGAAQMELFQRLLALRKAEADAHAAERAALLSQLNDALTALERYEVSHEGDGGDGADSDDDGGGWAAGERDDEGGGADDLDRSFAVLDFGDAEL